MFKKLLGIALTCFSLIGFAADQVRVIISTSEAYSTIGLMPEFCTKFDLDVHVLQKSASAYDAAAGGLIMLERKDADVVSATLFAALIGRSNGLPIYAITNVSSDGTHFIVNDSIKSYADLKGKRIATLRASATSIQVERNLKKYGVNPADVQWQYMPFSQMAVAFASGKVDGFIGTYPYTIQGLSSNGAAIDSFPTVARQMFASTSLNEETAKKFRKCNFELTKFLNTSSNTDAIKKMVARASERGIVVSISAATKYAYKINSDLPDSTVAEAIQFLKDTKKVKPDFVLPSDFNRTK